MSTEHGGAGRPDDGPRDGTRIDTGPSDTEGQDMDEHDPGWSDPGWSDPGGSDPGGPETRTAERTSGRHPVDIGHLVMGLVFATFVVIWALLTSDALDDRDLRWLLPVPWVLGGAAGLVAVVLRGRRR